MYTLQRKILKRLQALGTYIFVEGMSGMALGLFATLIIGTITEQIGKLIDGEVGSLIVLCASVIKALTGAGIGVGVAIKFKDAPLVAVSAAGAGMVGAFSSQILAATTAVDGGLFLKGPGEPLGAFIAVLVAVSLGRLVSGKTSIDILVTPLVTIVSGSVAGLLVGPPISAFMKWLGEIVVLGTELQPVLMGIVVSVLMGIILTLPISSAALGVAMNLTGLAAGAATVGCCANMIGFAVASFRENKWNGLFAQGLGTSMLQVPNLMRKPILWLAPVLSSAILGPIATAVFGMTNNAIGSGMGTSGLVGQIATLQTMTADHSVWYVLLLITLLHFILPAALSLLFSEIMRKIGWIKKDDLKLDI